MLLTVFFGALFSLKEEGDLIVYVLFFLTAWRSWIVKIHITFQIQGDSGSSYNIFEGDSMYNPEQKGFYEPFYEYFLDL